MEVEPETSPRRVIKGILVFERLGGRSFHLVEYRRPSRCKPVADRHSSMPIPLYRVVRMEAVIHSVRCRRV